MDILGHTYPARSSRRIDAVLRPSGGSVEVLGPLGEQLAHCLISELKIDPPLGRAPRRVTLPDGTLFETENHAAIEALSGPTAGGALHRFEAFHPRLVLVLVGIVAGILFLWRYGLDLMAGAAVALTPPPVISLIDDGVLTSVDLAIATPSTLGESDRRRVEAIFQRLIDDLPPGERGSFDFHLVYRKLEGLGPNAVALPNGTIIVTDEIVRLMFDDTEALERTIGHPVSGEDMLAGVLGHEIGHVVEKHGLRQLYRSVSFAVLVALLFGDTGPVVEDVVLEGSVVLSLQYSRRHEASADAFGVGLVERAGYDAQGLIDFFDYVGRNFGDDASFLSTHPAPSDRIEEIRRLMDQPSASR